LAISTDTPLGVFVDGSIVSKGGNFSSIPIFHVSESEISTFKLLVFCD
jgi:hypothetical protein